MISKITTHQRALRAAAEKAEAREAAAAKRAQEDAIWEAEGRRAAQRVVSGQVAAMEDHILDAFRNDLHRERRELVNLYTGTDRKQKIADLDLVIGAVEEEQAKRAGLASSTDILATFASPDFVTVEDSDHLATLLDVEEDEKAPKSIAQEFDRVVTAEHPAIQAAMQRKAARRAL